jgi:carboxymethylenebutenolidase
MSNHPVQIKLSYHALQGANPSAQPLQIYQAAPSHNQPLPAVLLIHEIYGLNDSIRSAAHRLAEQGYLAIAVDLFSGSSRLVRRAQALVGMAKRQLHHGILADLQTSLDYLNKLEEADSNKLAVIGYGMGGSYALHLSGAVPQVKAAGVFFAFKPENLQITPNTCPVIASYPENDFTSEDGLKLQQALDKQGVANDIKFYPQTLHSFTNEFIAVYNPAASEDAWQRLLNFFDRHLKKPVEGIQE